MKIDIDSDLEWTVSSNVSWLKPFSTRGQGSSSLSVSLDDNASVNQRTGTLTFKTSAVTKTVSFTQPGRTLSVSMSNVYFNSNGGTSDLIGITTDGQYKITASESWIEFSQSGNQLIIAASKTEANRNGTVTVALTNLLNGNVLEKVISVEQLAPITINGVSLVMIPVGGGTFHMGGSGSEGWISSQEPSHQVTLTYSYMIGQTEVTQELWEAVMDSNPSNFKDKKRPVENVSWNDCQTFIKRLNQLTGMQFRLPTDAEWEFAARGGNHSKGYRCAGSDNPEDVAWVNCRATHDVGTKQPNELGIYDMNGNVEEWCQDWYYNFTSSAQTNPRGPDNGSARVVRGGSFFSEDDWSFSVASRGSLGQDKTYSFQGFRLALGSF
jgi:formylglycine-generating enzyme required for sulfatase activity